MIGGIQGGMSSMTAADMQQMREQMREQMFARLDPDGDGQIDLEQVAADVEAKGAQGGRGAKFVEMLQKADANGDGMVSEEEFASMKPPEKPPEDFSAMMFDSEGQRPETYDLSGALLDVLG